MPQIEPGITNDRYELLSQSQRAVREKVNATFVPVAEKLIHQDFFVRAREYPGREALLWDEHGINQTMTYGELAGQALRLAALLAAKGVRPGDAVAVTLSRGPNQVVAVLAVLAAGAAYVPVGINQPAGRRNRICRISGISRLVTDQAGLALLSAPEGLTVIAVEEAEGVAPLPHPVSVATDALAYIIFTSGSTGEPKGVEITHRAAYNTILDINTRFSVTASDRVLAVSALDFDLSVYDIFGLLSAGGGVVLLDGGAGREALVWPGLIRRMKVTVWNSVPALLEMLLTVAGDNDPLTSLRLVLVSGDWVGLDLPGRLRKKSPDCRFIALGGATEASIWSNCFEVESVDPAWRSIPYGTPLSNQCFRVVDPLGRDCPDLVTGELWIGGLGVARGYRGAPELTAESFIDTDTGEHRWYRTGDLGRYRPDGVIEFWGRVDQQVKLRGYRIELGEIEAVLRQYEGVSQAAAVISSGGGAKHLAAAVVAGAAPAGGEVASVGPPDRDEGPGRHSLQELQWRITEAFMAEILNLAQLRDGTAEIPAIPGQLRITDQYRPLLQMWLRRLGERGVLADGTGVFRAGARMREVLQYAAELKLNAARGGGSTGDETLAAGIERRLFQRLEDYRGILSGEISAAVLLDDDLLAPESLSARDAGTMAGIGMMAEKIKDLAQSAGSPVETALLGGRSGIMAVRLLELLEPGEISLTLLDDAPSMVEAAKARLAALPHAVRCELLPENRVPDRLRYSFAAVLAVNSLHRYRDPRRGIAMASLLIRRGGKVLALEHCQLTPIALVTAAVLDGGFAHLDRDRRRAGDPMLPGRQWAHLFTQAGFQAAGFVPVEDTFTEFIEARCPEARPEPDPEDILKFTAAHLPAYMLPEKIELLPWLPLSANGKVDRGAVAALFQPRGEAAGGEKPRGEMEREVAGMWEELLHTGAIARRQGFFALGGDSLLATRFLAMVQERFGVRLSLRQMFEAPSLAQVAAVLESQMAEMKVHMEPMEEGEI